MAVLNTVEAIGDVEHDGVGVVAMFKGCSDTVAVAYEAVKALAPENREFTSAEV